MERSSKKELRQGRGGETKQKCNQIEQTTCVSLLLEGEAEQGTGVIPQGFTTDLSLLSLPAMGTVFWAAKEDGCTGGWCSGVQKQRRAGVI